MGRFVIRTNDLKTEMVDLIKLNLNSNLEICLNKDKPENVSDDFLSLMPLVKYKGKKLTLFGFRQTKNDKLKAILIKNKNGFTYVYEVKISKIPFEQIAEFLECLDQSDELLYPYQVNYMENGDTLSEYFYDYNEALTCYMLNAISNVETSLCESKGGVFYEVKFTYANIEDADNYRLTYRNEINIIAESEDEAKNIFEQLPTDVLNKISTFVEVVSVE